MSLWEDIQPYIDAETGLMQAGGGGRDNLILMSAYLYRELVRVDGCVPNSFQHHVTAFLNQTQVEPGLYRRLPGSTDDNSVDNLIGICWLSTYRSYLVRRRWREHFTCFDVNNPTKVALNRNFYGRFIGLKAFIIGSCSLDPGLIQRLLWCLSVWWSVKTSTGSSNPLLMSLQVDVMEKHCPVAAAYWKRHNSIHDLYFQYFGPTHPLTLSRIFTGKES